MKRLVLVASVSFPLFALACPVPAFADPVYGCSGVHQTSDGGAATINPVTGFVYCALAPGATVSLTGRVGPSADLGVSSTMSYTYDSQNRLTTDVDSSGQTSAYFYDGAGRLSRVDEVIPGPTPDITRYQYSYDSLNRLEQTSDPSAPAGHTITYQYDGFDRVIRAIDVAGALTTRYDYTYDSGSGRLETITDPDAGGAIRTEYQYDGIGRVIRTIDGAGNPTSYEYDAGTDRLTRTIYDSTGRITEYTYDALFRVSQSTFDATGSPVTTTYQYDPVSTNLLIAVLGATTTHLIFTENAAVPAPGGVALFGAALAALGLWRRRAVN